MLFHLFFITSLLIVAWVLGRALEKVMNKAEVLLERARSERPELAPQTSFNHAVATNPESFLSTLSSYSSAKSESETSRQ